MNLPNPYKFLNFIGDCPDTIGRPVPTLPIALNNALIQLQSKLLKLQTPKDLEFLCTVNRNRIKNIRKTAVASILND